ncbi:MAG: hypothetical protein PSY14_00645 [bacterium]|nr:hypothetical protein [bacterium]
MHKPNLTKIQRCILAILEEAGNENVATIINSAIRNSGRRNELNAIQVALDGLLKHELIKIINFDARAHEWVSCREEESYAFLTSLGSLVYWSDSIKAWTMQENVSSLEVALTEGGMIEAREILKNEGYPELNSILICTSDEL